jgi:hypothetical protein
MALTLPEAIDQLGDRTSPRRRSAAKQLPKLQDPSAGPAISLTGKYKTYRPL